MPLFFCFYAVLYCDVEPTTFVVLLVLCMMVCVQARLVGHVHDGLCASPHHHLQYQSLRLCSTAPQFELWIGRAHCLILGLFCSKKVGDLRGFGLSFFCLWSGCRELEFVLFCSFLLCEIWLKYCLKRQRIAVWRFRNIGAMLMRNMCHFNHISPLIPPQFGSNLLRFCLLNTEIFISL